MRILGLDPGSIHTGFGVVERHGSRLTVVAHGRISCQPKSPLPDRIAHIALELERLVAEHAPECAALETPFHGLNARSLIVLAQARGALLAVLGQRRLEIREYTPAEVKSAMTGHGRADKEQVAKMVSLILSLGGRKPSRDASDALAVAICCAQRRKMDDLVR